MRRHVSCGAVVTRVREGQTEILLMRHKPTGTWRLPKGTVEPHEPKRATAIRETREETGLDIKTSQFVGSLPSTYSRGGEIVLKETHYFLAREVGGSIENREEQFDLVEYVPIAFAIARLRHSLAFEAEWLIVEIVQAYLTKTARPAES